MAMAALASAVVWFIAGAPPLAQVSETHAGRPRGALVWLTGSWILPQGETPDFSWGEGSKSPRAAARGKPPDAGVYPRVVLTVSERGDVLAGSLETVTPRGERSGVATFSIDRGQTGCPLTWQEAGVRYRSLLERSGHGSCGEPGDMKERDPERLLRFARMQSGTRRSPYPIIIELGRRDEQLILRRVQGPQHGAAVDQIFRFVRVPSPPAGAGPASPAAIGDLRAPAPPPRGEWFLVGGVDQPTVVQPLGAGRALLCNRARCDVWDAASGTWTPTGAVVLPLNETAHVARRDETVVVVDGGRTVATAVWKAATGRWTTAAALPERLTSPHLLALSDGRALITGQSSVYLGSRAYLSTAALDRWTVVADAPARVTVTSPRPRLVPTPSGVLLLDGARAWRRSFVAPEWSPVPVPVPADGDDTFLEAWGDAILRLTQGHERWSAARLAFDGRDERPALGGSGAGRLSLRPISTADGAGAWWTETEGRQAWARHAHEPPVAVVPNRVAPGYLTVALDDMHLLEVSTTGAVVQLALDGRPPPGAACQGLSRYLASVSPDGVRGREASLVSAGCRAEAEGGHAPDLQRLVRGWAREEQRQASGRAFMCGLHDPVAAESLPRWLRDRRSPGRSTCLSVAATWPAAQPAYDAAIADGVYRHDAAWFVDGDLVASATTPALLERLTPMLRAAAGRRAWGFDNLRRLLCSDQAPASADRRAGCAATATLKESAWRDEERRADDQRRYAPRSRLPRVLVATALYGGAIATAYATRDGDVGRGITTGAGIVGGATLGVSLAGVAVLHGNWSRSEGEGVGMMIIAGLLLGGTLGGWALHAAAGPVDYRAPLTAAGLVLPYVLAIALPVD
jgi:hypothetical protein